ncbi:MAG TPA: ThiF family adenylyltransferase [Actinomycetota bacterium]
MTTGRWERVEGLVDVGHLRDRHVLVVGLGSGGSTVALELARAGVGRFTLVDPDRMEERNVIRHECDDRYLGWNKAEAVADLIRHRNPEASVEAVSANVFDLGGRLGEVVGDADLVAGCTDVEPPKSLLDRACLAARVPAVYAGVYERGVGGEVIRCAGGPADPCYACVMSVLKESAPVPAGDDLDYGMVAADGTLHGAPGLGLDVRLVALVHAKVCLLTLLAGTGGEDLPADVVLVGTARVDGLFSRPFASALLRVPPQEGCLACRPFRPAAV